MVVCQCQGVSDRRVRREIEHGAATIEEIAASCGAGAMCLGCHSTLDDLLLEAKPQVAAVAVARRRLQLA
jgi:bacterioferritin-associated ferredoxin